MTTRTSSSPPGGRTGRGLGALTDWVLAHKRTVAGLWVVLAIAGFWGAGQVTNALDDQFSMPDSDAFAANEQIEERFGNGGRTTPLVAVATFPDGTTVDSPGIRGELRALESELERAVPGSRVASYGSTGERAYVSDDGRTTFAVLHPTLLDQSGPDFGEIDAETLGAVRKATANANVGGAEVLLTGEAALLDEPAPPNAAGPEFLSETLIAGVAALAVLAFVFASALALVPLVMAVVAIPTTLLAVLGLTELTSVSFIVVFLVALIGLGIAIDYALIVVMRWREERERGLANEDAVRAAIATAGRAVLFSGTTVAIGLMAAVVLPIPFLQSMGYGGLLIPLVSVAVALTLLPVVLATLGPRADRHRLRRTDRAERNWARWAALVIRHRVAAAVGGVTVLLALCVVAAGMTLGEAEAEALGGSGEPKQALSALEESGIGPGPLSPIEVITPTSQASATAHELAAVDGVRAASAPAGWSAERQAVVEVFAAEDTNSGAGRDTTDAVVAAAAGMPSTHIGGETAVVLDFNDSIYSSFPVMLALISVVTFVLLARAFRSIVLPLKAVVMNLLSVFATWGVMALVWQHGFGTELLFGADPAGSVVFWSPVIVFAFIYGLSMDYEVFILSRMREEYDRTGSTERAVVRGIANTGRLVTSAALIVFLAFGSMALEGDLDVQMLATGLAAGVLLDAIVIRSLLVPAMVSWLGKWNWWMPEPARRILRLREAPPEPALDGGFR